MSGLDSTRSTCLSHIPCRLLEVGETAEIHAFRIDGHDASLDVEAGWLSLEKLISVPGSKGLGLQGRVRSTVVM